MILHRRNYIEFPRLILGKYFIYTANLRCNGDYLTKPLCKWRKILYHFCFLETVEDLRNMVVIRLARGGTNKKPFYHVIIADHRKPRDGRFIEKVGFYDPHPKGKAIGLQLKMARIEHWMAVGAKPSDRVAHLIQTAKEQSTTQQ
jgi:small subunit ribosomal protein S16